MEIVVDDRTFVIGLCELFRTRMKEHETSVLLPHAEAACRELGLTPSETPIEGYYSESPALTRFFRLVRALQRAPESSPASDRAGESLRELRRVFGSPALGRPLASDRLLAMTDSPLGEALRQSDVWSIPHLTRESKRLVRPDDASLGAVAASTGDPVALGVARESVALSADVSTAEAELPGYRWTVSPDVAKVAERFVATLREATSIELPVPAAASAAEYGAAAQGAAIDGRCIRIGERPETTHPQYHWYIQATEKGCGVSDFWSTAVWTTEALRRLSPSRRPRAGSRVGSPGSTPAI
jgi:hypothetical protein